MKSMTKEFLDAERNIKPFGSQQVFTSTGQLAISEKLYSIEEIKKINEEIVKYESDSVEEPEDHTTSNVIKSAKTRIFPCMTLADHLDKFIVFIMDSNRRLFGYDIYLGLPAESYNYNEYDEGDEYGWHFDAEVGSGSDIKLTCILNLSEEPYEGGNFLITGVEENQIEEWGVNTPGTAIAFNSIRSHKVNPVTKGKRITLSYWALGPKWK